MLFWLYLRGTVLVSDPQWNRDGSEGTRAHEAPRLEHKKGKEGRSRGRKEYKSRRSSNKPSCTNPTSCAVQCCTQETGRD